MAFPWYLLVQVLLLADISQECALPFWWNQQYNFQPFSSQGGAPKTTYRYRQMIHRQDPNNYVHVEEYSEYTWFEHSSNNNNNNNNELPNQVLPQDIRHMTNVVFGKDANSHNFGFPQTFGFGFPGKTNRGNLPNPHENTNNIVPKGVGDETVPQNPNQVGSNSIDRKNPFDDTNGMIPMPDTTGAETTSRPSSIRTAPDTTSSILTSSATNSIPTSLETNEMATEEDVRQTSPEVPNVDFEAPDRERNENENLEVSKVGDEDNDLEASSANRASAKIKEEEKQEKKSSTSFFGGWFGKRNENETEPCKVSGTDIHSLRSMIENMFSFPREHIINPESKEKVREDIINKFRNFGLQVWTQNFTTPLMPSANGTEETNEGVNLIGVIPGSQRGRLDDEIVLVGAHYDTVPDSNGVDDNGSGLAVMLEVARIITEARCRLNHTLMFVAFDHEENGAMGSNYFVDHYLIPEELKRARARFQGAFILDGILNYNDVPNTQELPIDYAESLPGFKYFVNNTGNRGNFLAMISRNEMDNNLSDKLMNAWQDLGDSKYKLFNLQVDMGNSIPEPSVIEKHVNFLTSDHATFWYHNSSSHFPESLNAVLLTDTGPFRGQMKKCYHSKCDDLTVISPEKLQFAKKTADALTATLVELTSATGTGNYINLSWFLYSAHAISLYYTSKMFLKF
ncbi:uncharacterized protein [Parasteatoda tepidariorum]|uniref:uncharacterized protein n=1 Tax=Parasteatoda tepidariorum TaxID=114398 RepID=UPI001C728C14|nr:uncharacterized protein LOC107443337 [Parasteatoda tepidariorum]